MCIRQNAQNVNHLRQHLTDVWNRALSVMTLTGDVSVSMPVFSLTGEHFDYSLCHCEHIVKTLLTVIN